MRTATGPIVLFLISIVACGGRNNTSTSTSEISGAYEFVVTSDVTGSTTLVEANMTGTGNQSGATGPSQVQVITLEKKNWYVNGVCPGATPGENAVSANVTGSNVAFAFSEGGNVVPGEGVLAGTTVTGNYSISGSQCPDLIGVVGFPPGTDFGGFVGNQVPALAGTFSGPLNLPDGTDNVEMGLSEGTNNGLTVTAQVNGAVDNGTYTLTGSAVGNIMFVSGTVNGQSLSLFGYFDRAGTFTGMPNSMLVFNYTTLTQVGLLTSSQ
jgi:hypothetical protein